MEADPSLDDRLNDTVVLVTKGALGAVPFVGGLLAEVLGRLVPNQRIDRIADFLLALAARVEHVEKEVLVQALTSPEGRDLLEDGLAAASRALTVGRRKRLAAAFAKALTAIEIDHIYRKRLLQIAAGLSDAELIMLHAIHLYWRNALAADFVARHEPILRGPAYQFDVRLENQPEYVRYETLLQNLTSLKLITPTANASLVVGMTVAPLLREGALVANYELTALGSTVMGMMVAEDENDVDG
jgi:hypothetical protein